MRMSTHAQLIPLLALGAVLGLAGCHSNTAPNQPQNAAQVTDDSQDPAMEANLAPAVNTSLSRKRPSRQPRLSRVLPQARRSSRPLRLHRPIETAAAPSEAPSEEGYDYNAPVQDYQDQAQPVEYATAPPPPLPEYDQPPCPGDNYIWTPGYWGYAPTGYYWVPGVWVIAPYIGSLWTPGYWGFYGNRYGWHPGYWGPHIGFYGGVNYGYGYVGTGYVGGYWRNNNFMYNTSVTHVNTTIIHNTYVHNVTIVNNTRVSYNGGHGGLTARPLPAENVAWREHHMGALPEQVAHARQASTNRQQWASVNHGRPATLTAPRPLTSDRRAPAPTPPAIQSQVRQEQVRQQQLRQEQARNVGRSLPENRPAPVNRPESRPATPEARPTERTPGGTARNASCTCPPGNPTRDSGETSRTTGNS